MIIIPQQTAKQTLKQLQGDLQAKYMNRPIITLLRRHRGSQQILAMSKLNTISDLVSTSLRDSHISDDEFKLIMNEVDRYNKLKYEIRSKPRKNYTAITISAEEKNKLIDNIRKMVNK